MKNICLLIEEYYTQGLYLSIILTCQVTFTFGITIDSNDEWILGTYVNDTFLQFTGNYSCLVAHFYLKRSVSFHLIQSYLPSILIVAISWVSFWMDIEAVPGRISLGVITLLAVSSQTGQGKTSDLFSFFLCEKWPLAQNSIYTPPKEWIYFLLTEKNVPQTSYVKVSQ